MIILKRTVIFGLLALFFLVPLSTPQPAEAGIGLIQVIDNGATREYLGDGMWCATFSNPRYLDDLVTPIEPRWVWDDDMDEWVTGPNLFSATVYQSTTRVRYEDDSGINRELSWRPDVYIGNTLLWPISNQLMLTDPINDYYSANILKWDYGNGIIRHLRVIEGMLMEYYTIAQMPSDKIVISPHVNKDAGFVWARPHSAWDADGMPISLEIDPISSSITLTSAVMSQAKFPITIDPETSFDSSSSDGTIGIHASTYSSCHNADAGDWLETSYTYLTVGQFSQDSDYYIYRCFVFFDTTSLPDDDTIIEGSVNLYTYSKAITPSVEGTHEFYTIIQSGMPTYPHDPLQVSDFYYGAYSGNGGQKYSTAMITGRYDAIFLNSDGLSWVNVDDWTKFALRSSKDINSISPGTTAQEGMHFGSYERGTNYVPTLSITYEHVVDAPVVTTSNPTDVLETNARLWGYLSEDGGEDCSVKFEYGPTTALGTSTTWQSGVAAGTQFSEVVPSLEHGSIYHYKAVASNSNTTEYGADKSFLTHPGGPSNPTAVASSGQVALSWTKGTGAVRTIVYYRTDRFPLLEITESSGTEYISSDGAQIYLDTGSTYTHTGLTDGTTYYYTLVSEVTSEAMTRYSRYSEDIYGIPETLDSPQVRTDGVTNVADTSATLHGYLLSLGGYISCNASFQYRLGDSGEWTNTTPEINMTALEPFSDGITGLSIASTYQFRAKGVNADGTAYGNTLEFDTGGTSAPTMDTMSATGVTMTEAVLHGKVVSDGGISVTAWFVWGKTTACSDGQSSTASGLTTGQEAVYDVAGLEKETDYYYMIVGENTKGTSYGDVVTFRTAAPDAPIVETKDATQIGSYTAMLNGLLVNDGDMDCLVRFAWGTTTSCDIPTAWQYNKRQGDSFEAAIGNLVVGQTYYFKAQARNNGVISSGAIKEFTTVFGAPADFEAKTLSSTTVRVSWAPRGDQTYIVYLTTGYPSSRSVGNLLYFGSDETVTHTQCIPGTTYYYRAWSWADGTFSSAYSSVMATTSASGTQQDEMPDLVGLVEEPDRWLTGPEYTHLANLPIYSIVNDAADAYDMPRSTFWLGLAIMGAICLGVGAYFAANRSEWIALLACGLGFGIGYWLMIIPLWMLFIYLVVGGGLMYVMKRA